MSRRPKSVPGREMKSKFISNRTNATKEIEAWVRGEDGYYQRDAVRMSGQLTDNVTEERMLRAKLWELSRERYKFLSQNAYERKVFVDRIQRKSSANRRNTLQLERIAGEKSGGRKVKSGNARLSLLDRFDPTMSRDRPKQFKEIAGPGDTSTNRAKFVHFGQSPVDETEEIRQPLNRPEIVALSEQNVAKRSFSASHCRTLPSLSDHVSQKSEAAPDTMPRLEGAVHPMGSVRPVRSSKRAKSGSFSSSSSTFNGVRLCADPRITKLEGSLAPVYTTDNCPDVSSVVKEIGSLHLRPKINKETTKPKTSVKILDHMRAKGLIL